MCAWFQIVDPRKKGRNETTTKDYIYKLYPTGYLWNYWYEVVKGHNRGTWRKWDYVNIGKLNRDDTMGGSTRNSGWVAGEYGLGNAYNTNVIYMSHYVNNIFHPHTIDSTIKSGLVDTGSSGTYTRPDNTHKNSHKQSHKVFVSSSCSNNIPSNTECTLELP